MDGTLKRMEVGLLSLIHIFADGPDGGYLTFEGVEGLPPSVDFEDLSDNA